MARTRNTKLAGDIETLGRWDLDKKLLSNMTAHPKIDMDTKETFAFSWSFVFPHLTFFRFDEKGIKQKEVPIFSMHNPSLTHDFAITKRFAIFHETQLVMSLAKVLMGRGTPVVYEPKQRTRFGVIPRQAKCDSEMKWFEVQGFNAAHIINSWESSDEEIVIVASNVKSIENFLVNKKLDVVLEKVKINLKTGKVHRNIISTKNLELGSINSSYVGKKTRYAYLGVLEETPKTSGLVKIDLETGDEVGKRFYGDGCFGGEPLFVRRNEYNGDDEDGECNEDDGFVMTFVHNEHTNESIFLVMDAKSPELNTIAKIKLPRRVPYGFHGLFLAN
ncbi:Carotenoid oxygenase [Corchorus olitorius]|uniref:Carotenoid oxygenase n=1 Tax=Corchorus olitorius TaxID=93759 RepID=A0A1R3I3E7_9ROSI|nr:Carotenoid oxygenase [Corchorus olitorius]